MTEVAKDCRALKAAQHNALPVSAARMMGLETAVALLGSVEQLAKAMKIEPRSLRSKLTADRGISAENLELAADALEARAEKILGHARKLRAEAAPPESTGDAGQPGETA